MRNRALRRFVIAVFLALPAMGYTRSNPSTPSPPEVQKPEQNPRAPISQPEPDKNGANTTPPIVKETPSEDTKPKPSEHSYTTKDNSSADWWMVKLTAVLAFIGVLQLFVFGLQARRLRQTIETMDRLGKEQSSDMKDSIAVAKDSAIAAADSNKLARELFQSEQRAWISAAATLASGLTWEEGGARLYIDVILDNVGKSPALDVSFEADTFMLGRENPEPEAGLCQFCEKIVQRRSSPRAKGVTVFPGKPTHVRFGLLVRRTDIDRNIVIKPDWFSPMIQGCVVYKTIGSPDMKYTGILYNILARHETDPMLTMMLRISNGDLQPNQFGIGPYPGGDIAT